MEGKKDNITIGRSGKQCESETECNTDECCQSSSIDETTTALFKDRVEVYDRCSNQQSCNVTSPYVNNTDYGYIKYSYYCIDDQQNINIRNDIEDSFKGDIYIHLNGSSGSWLPRCCQITSFVTITVNSYYINLGAESCRGIKINNQTLFNCSTENRLIRLRKKLISGVEIDIDILQFEPQDLIWINLHIDPRSQINVRCRSCNSYETSSQETTSNGTDITTALSHTTTSPKHRCKYIYALSGFLILTIILSVLLSIVIVCLLRKQQVNKCLKMNCTDARNSNIIIDGSQYLSNKAYYEAINGHHYEDIL
ncbi:uncharacterized protein LOC126823588 [Patella vulgata]|uniref:uncharacterized protein LOC126823588 n=1 Tax=Patella vulgata TaxID=6465 RepID=UPI0024A9F0B2|nr:uncharacterized protein LOC126823588 [Patella vulgata]